MTDQTEKRYEHELTIDDLDCLSLGMVYDILTEAANDDCEYKQIATQEDFDRF